MTENYRHLPPVEPVEPPSRFSMTTLQRHDNCPRSSYLGIKYREGPSSHPMDRGTLFHEAVARMMRDLVIAQVPRLAPDDPTQAASMTAAIVDEVLRERPDLVVPRAQVDDVREMMFHVAIGYDVDPQTLAVPPETLFVLDLECGWTVSGRLDLAAFPSAELGQVDDWKTRPAPRSQEEYEASLQPMVYAALLCYGVPVEIVPCGCPGGIECPQCDGKGYVEVRGECIGKHLKGVNLREVYPHPKLRDDGLLHHREMLLARTAIADFRADLERMAAMLGERFQTWQFPAVSGSWCSICPARWECPLPAHLRDHAGTINSLSEAEEALEKVQHEKARISAIEREIKNWSKAHGLAIRVGDEQWEWTTTEGKALKKAGRGSDWEGLEAALEETANFGTPFDITEWVKPTVGSSFKKSKTNANGDSR